MKLTDINEGIGYKITHKTNGDYLIAARKDFNGEKLAMFSEHTRETFFFTVLENGDLSHEEYEIGYVSPSDSVGEDTEPMAQNPVEATETQPTEVLPTPEQSPAEDSSTPTEPTAPAETTAPIDQVLDQTTTPEN